MVEFMFVWEVNRRGPGTEAGAVSSTVGLVRGRSARRKGMSKNNSDLVHWLSRARDARATAAHTSDADAKRIVLEVAESCEDMARRAGKVRGWVQKTQ